MRGHADHHAAPNLSSNKRANWVLASATRSEMVSNGTHRKRRNGKTVTLSRASFGARWPSCVTSGCLTARKAWIDEFLE